MLRITSVAAEPPDRATAPFLAPLAPTGASGAGEENQSSTRRNIVLGLVWRTADTGVDTRIS